MQSRRNLLIATGALACVAMAIAFTLADRADAAPPFGLRSLDGAYHFTAVEIREGAPPVYCNSFGILMFDGDGVVTIDDAWGYGTCSNGDTHIEDLTMGYEVFSDGSVILTELASGNGYVTHCQILDKGKLLLCDGTGGGPGAVLGPGQLLWTATAGKL